MHAYTFGVVEYTSSNNVQNFRYALTFRSHRPTWEADLLRKTEVARWKIGAFLRDFSMQLHNRFAECSDRQSRA